MKLGFIGAGNMGEAYISGLSSKNEIYFYETNNEREEYIREKYNSIPCKTIAEILEKADYIFLAVKPNVISFVLEKIKELAYEGNKLKNKIILSVAAGIKINQIQKSIGIDKKIVRVMPNTPALIQKGMTGYCLSENINKEEEIKIEEILSATGEILKVEEKQMDILTAISGSGPAYVFLILNSFADAGVKLGMTKKNALKLATETFIGAAEMLKQTGKHPEELKDMVTSPGGTTAAGLFELEKNSVRKAIIETVESAYNKSLELGGKD